MREKDLFAAGVRILGLVAIGRGLFDVIFVIAFSLGAANYSVTTKYPGFDLVAGILYILAGVYLLRGAPAVMDFAYPVREPAPSLESTDDLTDDDHAHE